MPPRSCVPKPTVVVEHTLWQSNPLASKDTAQTHVHETFMKVFFSETTRITLIPIVCTNVKKNSKLNCKYISLISCTQDFRDNCWGGGAALTKHYNES